MPPIWTGSDLLSGRNPSAPLASFDGKAAAIIKAFVYTTPNQDVVWAPGSTKDGVYLRADLRYGPHDPTLWPQLYVASLCHLGAIPSKPIDPADPLSIMWWNPTRGDFISSEGGVLDGLGKLSGARYAQFQSMRWEMLDRVNQYRMKTSSPNPWVFPLERTLVHACTRLGTLSTTFTKMVLGVTDFQRCYLELLGLLDYVEIYHPRMEGRLPAATTVEKCVGANVVSPRVVQDFFTAGIPVWFVQPCKTGPFPYNVLNVVTPFEPADFLCLEHHNPPFPIIYDGSGVRDKHDALHHFSQTLSLFNDPFQHASSGPSTNRARQALRSSVSQPNQSGGRNKFLPLESPLAPFSISAWSTALQAVDRSSSHLVSQSANHSIGYAFPDPGLFITPVTNEKKSKLLGTWLRVREAWILRVADGKPMAMSGQRWRDLLATDFDVYLTTGDTKAATRRRNILEQLKPKSMCSPELKTRSIVGEPLFWQGKRYPPGVLPVADVVREILWELFELNFTRELVALDRRACKDLDLSDNSRLSERQDTISKCFSIGEFAHVSIPACNRGLAANTLQDRLLYVICLVHVMQSWKGDVPDVFSLANQAPLDLSQDQVKELEEAAAKHYCQQFFNYFGRAALVLHRLFSTHS